MTISRRGILHAFESRYNCISTELCSPHRHAMCVRERCCDKCNPTCDMERQSLLGISAGKWWRVGWRQRHRWMEEIENMMAKKVGDCRPVTVTIEDA